ncbi:transcription factor bHLH18 [Trifolium repens]|nr:transcription factor bHLH18 [Trifolium repens]
MGIENWLEMCQEEDYLGDYISLEAPALAVAAPENTLQEICHISTVVSSEMIVCSNKSPELLPPSTSSRTCIISFDNSAVTPLKPFVISSKPPRPPCSAKKRNSEKLKSLEAKAINKEGENKIIRSGSKAIHTLVERKRRLELANKFIELSTTIPNLKKKDKASIVMGAINHVEQLQKRVKELEKQNKRGKEPTVERLPYVKAKVLEKNILIYINCEKQNGIELKILEMLENLHLFVISTSVLPFGSSTLGITIIAKMDDAYKTRMVDLMDNVRQLLLNGSAKHPT